jgi:transcription termination/antitermination protein NusG
MQDKDNKWYVLFVMTGKEDKVKERLQYRLKNKSLKVIVPKRRLRERRNGIWEYRIRTLFPGYVLINGYIDTKDYYMLKEVPGLLGILKNNNEPLEVQEEEIRIIGNLISSNEIIDCSRILIDKGRVVVVDGPLVGMEGLIKTIDKRKGRAKVMINFIGEPKLVDLSISMIQNF